MEESKKKRKLVPQDWNPHIALEILYRVWRVLFAFIKIAAGAAVTAGLVVAVCLFVFVGKFGDFLQDEILPDAALDLNELTVDLNSTIYYVDSNNEIQVQQEIDAKMDRKWVAYEDIPEAMIHATVAVEDHRFYKHQGVDWITTLQAFSRMFFGDASVGGSSITQQLVKNTFGNDSVTVQRKLLEIFQATQMEKRYDKDTILEYYLNIIYLGQNCNGIKTAAETYYGKELEQLTTAECASIIGITNSPTFYDPYQNLENNRKRRDTILWLMRQQGYLTEEEYQAGIAEEINLKFGIDFEDKIVQCENADCLYKGTVSTLTPGTEEGVYLCPECTQIVPIERDTTSGVYSYHTEAVIKDVAKAMAEKDGAEWNYGTQEIYMQRIQSGGYHIYSTLNWDVQQQIEAIYSDLSNIPEIRGGQQLQSAIVVVDNFTGDIVGIAGGTDVKTEFYGWDRSIAELQSGSSIKPLSVYGPAFEMGVITPATVVKDLPLKYDADGDNWPRNDNRTYNYSRTIFSAVTSSVNAVCAWTLDTIGTDYSFDFAKNKFHLSTLIEDYVDANGTVHTDNDYAPLAMGAQTWGITVRDMATAYATFANKGVYREGRTFTKVLDSTGKVVLVNEQSQEQILSEKSVDYMNYCLVNATRNGTGWEADLRDDYGVSTAGKTGTTTGNKARWYCGFTHYYTAAVWCGFDQPESINPVYVNNPSAVLFKSVMGPLHEEKENVFLYRYQDMQEVEMCLDSGKLATEACKKDCRNFSRTAKANVFPEDIPTEYCDKHITVEICSACGGVANEWCQKFAAEFLKAQDPAWVMPQYLKGMTPVTIEEKVLVKMTQEEMDEIAKALQCGLTANFKGKDWVYFVNKDGSATQNPHPGCTCGDHTEKAWNDYLESLKPPAPPEDPDVGGGEDDPTHGGGTIPLPW